MSRRRKPPSATIKGLVRERSPSRRVASRKGRSSDEVQERRASNGVGEVVELAPKGTSATKGNRNPGLRLPPANQRSAKRRGDITAQLWRF
jgi:hypothetical protein